MQKKRVILIGDRKKEKARLIVGELTGWLKENNSSVKVDLSSHLNLSKIKADIIIVLGGDGSILSTARRLGKNPIPVLGINLGKFGFMAGYSPEELKESISQILSHKYKSAPRLILSCEVLRHNREVGSFLALNDVVITRGAISRMIHLKLLINRKELTTFGADGLIVSTPTGSTAHSLSAGGPILYPSLKGFVLTPVCAHTLSMRPLVIPPSDSISMELTGKIKGVTAPASGGKESHQNRLRQEVILTIDGQVFMRLQSGDVVNISAAGHTFRLIESSRRTFYDTLREKMLWGGQPHHNELMTND